MKSFFSFSKQKLYSFDNLLTVFNRRYEGQMSSKQIADWMKISVVDVKKITLRLMSMDVLGYDSENGLWYRGNSDLKQPKQITINKKLLKKMLIMMGVMGFGAIAITWWLWNPDAFMQIINQIGGIFGQN